MSRWTDVGHNKPDRKRRAYLDIAPINVFVFLFALPGVVRSGLSPGPDDPKAWYDRAIRVVGGAFILLAIGGGLVLLIVLNIMDHFATSP